MLSKACIVGIYQPKLAAISRRGLQLKVLVPPSWKDERGEQFLEGGQGDGYELYAIPLRLNGNYHLHHYPSLGRELRAFKPDIVHIDEEPYNLASWQALYHARSVGAKSLFFSWQNINRAYPPPFSWGESWVYRCADHALAGTDDAAAVLRDKGYAGPLATIPQFGTDIELFQPAPSRPKRPFTIGFFGRIVPEKGLEILLRAASSLEGEWQLRLVGGGSASSDMRNLASSLGIIERVEFVGQLPSAELPAQYHAIDLLVLPSLTRSNWKEQFGRVLVEAMASGVPVIGSDSGAIPSVIGDAGLVLPEGDAAALARAMQQLMGQPRLRKRMIERGRVRFLEHFTHEGIAQATVNVYREMMQGARSGAGAE